MKAKIGTKDDHEIVDRLATRAGPIETVLGVSLVARA